MRLSTISILETCGRVSEFGPHITVELWKHSHSAIQPLVGLFYSIDIIKKFVD